MTYFLLAVAFLLELVAFVSFACAGVIVTKSRLLQIVLGAVLFALVITFWSLFMAPKAPKKFKPLPYYCAKLKIYAVSAFVLFQTQDTVIATSFAVLVVGDEALLYKHNLE